MLVPAGVPVKIASQGLETGISDFVSPIFYGLILSDIQTYEEACSF
jgi:hypothetical protein